MVRFIPTVSLHGSGESIELSNYQSDFILTQGATGLGMGPREVSTVALPSGGSMVRHRKGLESKLQIPILLGGTERQRWNMRRKLERLARDEVEIRVTRPNGVSRSRFGYYTQGLEGSYGAGEDSPDGQKIVLEFLCPDEYWRGAEENPTFKLMGLRKKFLSERPEKIEGKLTKSERAPTAGDPGEIGDVWLTGEPSEGQNLITNGDLSLGSSEGWRDDAVYSLDGGPDDGPMVTFPVTDTYLYDPFQGQRFPVTAGETLFFEAWIKADSPDSMLYITMQDQSGPNTSTSGRVQEWTDVEGGGAGANQGPVAKYTVPTEWKRVVSSKVIPEGVESLVVQAFYNNHSSGSNTDAQISFAGMKLYRPVIQPTARYKHDGSAWVDAGLEYVSPFLPVVLAGSTIQGVHTVEIGGDAPVYPTYVVDGPGSDLIIENDRGQSIKVLTSFEEQVTITTNPLRRDIVSPSNPDGELWEYVPTTSEFFALEPGSQKIKFSMVGSKPTSRVRIIYRENYWAGW